MARPTKIGLDYFPLDVDVFEDEKIEAIAGEFGNAGELLVIKLMCLIYKNGYYIEWTPLLRMKMLRRLDGADAEYLDRVLERMVEWGIFDKKLFEEEQILTSVRIQKTFQEATIRRKKPQFGSYCLINVNNNYSSNGVSDSISTQSKVKESKVKESKVKESKEVKESVKKKDTKTTASKAKKSSSKKKKAKAPKKEFGEFKNILLTEEEYNRLITRFGEGTITRYIEKMSDWLAATGRKPYKNYNAAIQTWLRNDNVKPITDNKNANDELEEFYKQNDIDTSFMHEKENLTGPF